MMNGVSLVPFSMADAENNEREKIPTRFWTRSDDDFLARSMRVPDLHAIPTQKTAK